MIEVVIHPTGDRAECPYDADVTEACEASRVAARTLLKEATEHGAGRPTASFYVDGQLVRADITRAEL